MKNFSSLKQLLVKLASNYQNAPENITQDHISILGIHNDDDSYLHVAWLAKKCGMYDHFLMTIREFYKPQREAHLAKKKVTKFLDWVDMNTWGYTGLSFTAFLFIACIACS